MLKIDIVAQTPKPSNKTAAAITAWLDLGPEEPLARRATITQHPGWSDVQRRMQAGPIKSAYLSASAEQLLVLPAASACYYPEYEKIKILASDALATAEERQADSLIFILDAASIQDIGNVAEGLELAAYNFTKYKKNGGMQKKQVGITFLVREQVLADAKKEVQARQKLCEFVNAARDLVNEPGSVCTPYTIEQQARKVAQAGKLGIDVLDEKELKKQGYEGLLAVGRGGCCPPCMIILSYDSSGSPGSRKAKAPQKKSSGGGVHLGLLGKGVTFDTGGVSIKPAAKMWEMKGDMAGAAAVLYGMAAIAYFKPKVRVTGIIVTAQNCVDSKALLPGDVIRARNGKTIHVDNTDAEGRLILTDGLWRAGEENVTHLVDFATLTGAIVRALGTSISGAFGNDDFADRVVEAANSQGEMCWRMPLWDEYIELMKTDVADLNNIGSKPEGGAITAALFLKEFLPDGVHWAHLDIAGTFIISGRWKYYRPGASGVMVRTIEKLAQEMAK